MANKNHSQIVIISFLILYTGHASKTPVTVH